MKNTHNRNVNVLLILFIVISLIIANIAMASVNEAEIKVTQVFEQIESSLTKLKTTNQFTQNNIRNELTQYLLPEVNIKFFSNKVLNKNLQKVPEELRDEFSTELSKQLINTYSHLLSKYNNEKISIDKGTLSKSGKIAMVNVTILSENKVNKAVVKLLKSNDGNWQFFDIVIEGISLLDSKQAEINSSFNKLGPEGTLQRIKELNKQNIIAS